ncbi:hypothetical protein [Planococcus halotolerans]|uniref:Uncharacterized protein n=1 Tax=Planococcus halotolerans TaxID=2233542 RepID=A0A365L7R0_9BACL|nr:hypothetical protein [Planococcus halotolerans]QHJ69894.1 hypothetical protein DNR44_004450 [Planococcus halotolerans]RAZ81415.1 hypothetical protein DP120_03805 [Planococcus halotolerans]
MNFSKKKFNLRFPLILLLINLVLFSFLIEELVDAAPPNYGGGLQLLTPLLGFISFWYIKKTEGEKPSGIWVLQALNWLFILFPIAAILFGMFTFI